MAIIGAGRIGGFNGNYGGANIYVDVSDLMQTIEMMRSVMTEEAFAEMLRRTFMDAGRKVKTIVRTEIPQDYEVTAGWAGSAVGFPKMGGGSGISVTIPIKGARGSIGGRFPATGGSFSRKGYTYTRNGKTITVKGRRINKQIRAKIVKGQSSTLPATMDHQGGQPPFMIHGVAFTRKQAGKSHPIAHVVGLGVPQMPINRSKDDVQNAIKDVVETRLVHHFGQLFGK